MFLGVVDAHFQEYLLCALQAQAFANMRARRPQYNEATAMWSLEMNL